MENEIKERKEREYFIIHINYSTNKYYIYMYHRFRKFTINQAWKFINDGFDDPVLLSTYIESFGNINNRNEEEILQEINNLYFEPREEKNPLKKTVILKTLVISDEEGNDIKKVYPSEEKYDNDFNKLIEKISDEEAPADSTLIQQEFLDEEKDLIKEDFVKFEEVLKQNKFIDCYFDGKLKLTPELIKTYSVYPCIFPLIYKFFPLSVIEHKENCSIKVETRLGTIFILRPINCESSCFEYDSEQYLKEHYYDVSLCIF